MTHLLEECVVFNKLLVPFHDTVFMLNIRKEERDTLFTVDTYTTSKLCLNHSFHDKYLQQINSICLNSVQNGSEHSQWNA